METQKLIEIREAVDELFAISDREVVRILSDYLEWMRQKDNPSE